MHSSGVLAMPCRVLCAACTAHRQREGAEERRAGGNLPRRLQVPGGWVTTQHVTSCEESALALLTAWSLQRLVELAGLLEALTYGTTPCILSIYLCWLPLLPGWRRSCRQKTFGDARLTAWTTPSDRARSASAQEETQWVDEQGSSTTSSSPGEGEQRKWMRHQRAFSLVCLSC